MVGDDKSTKIFLHLLHHVIEVCACVRNSKSRGNIAHMNISYDKAYELSMGIAALPPSPARWALAMTTCSIIPSHDRKITHGRDAPKDERVAVYAASNKGTG